MKKVLSIMIVLAVIAASAFAVDFNLNVGLGGSINSGKKAEKSGLEKEPELKYGGFDVQLGFNAELDNHLVIYDNIDFVFIGGDIEYKNKTVTKWTKQSGVDTKFQVSEDIGAGYAWHFNAMRLILGGGLHTDFLMYKMKKSTGIDNDMNTVTHIGLNVLIQGEYLLNEHFGLFVALKPSVNFLNSWKDKSGTTDVDASEGALGFNGSAVVGATFKF